MYTVNARMQECKNARNLLGRAFLRAYFKELFAHARALL